MKTILITGANGQLGQSLQQLQGNYPEFHFLYTDVDTLDICDESAVMSFIHQHAVGYIINCAAYTAVDKAEEQPELCDKINCAAVRNLGLAAQKVGARVLHVSTDYVFDGNHYIPYTESDPTCPVSIYGKTKRAGEIALQTVCPDSVIVRTAWLYSEYGANFLKTMRRLGAERESISVIFDQVGSPTYAVDLAQALLQIIVTSEKGDFQPGVFHYSNEGVCSWYDFAWKIMQLSELPAKVGAIESKDFPAKAPRPHYSVLNKVKIKTTYGVLVPHWEEALCRCLAKLNKNS